MDDRQFHLLARPVLVRFKELEQRMSTPNFHQDPAFASVAKEHNLLQEKVSAIQAWEKIHLEILQIAKMGEDRDPELAELVQAEKETLLLKLQTLEKHLLRLLIPKDPNENKNIILEIRAGAGGDESSLFAEELARMYSRFAETQGLTCEVLSSSPSDRGGFKEIIFSIEGFSKPFNSGAYGLFKYEMGVHRVQRVPETEANGRIHTSTVTVAVLLEAEEVDIQVRMEDLRIDTYRASGAGGQHINKTDSAVRMTHLPSGVVVQCQDERSQIKNREKAMKLLRSRLFQAAQEEQFKKMASNRKKQVGSGDRSEKIRTYNFPQDRITDHRIGFSAHHIQDFLDGNLRPMIEALQVAEQNQAQNLATGGDAL